MSLIQYSTSPIYFVVPFFLFPLLRSIYIFSSSTGTYACGTPLLVGVLSYCKFKLRSCTVVVSVPSCACCQFLSFHPSYSSYLASMDRQAIWRRGASLLQQSKKTESPLPPSRSPPPSHRRSSPLYITLPSFPKFLPTMHVLGRDKLSLTVPSFFLIRRVATFTSFFTFRSSLFFVFLFPFFPAPC